MISILKVDGDHTSSPASRHPSIQTQREREYWRLVEGVIRRMEKGNYHISPSEILNGAAPQYYGQQWARSGGWSEMAGNGPEPEPRPAGASHCNARLSGQGSGDIHHVYHKYHIHHFNASIFNTSILENTRPLFVFSHS